MPRKKKANTDPKRYKSAQGNKNENQGSSKQCSNTTEHQNPNHAAEDRIRLLQLLPEELWLLVFKKFKSPDDLLQLSNSSLIFRDWLLPRRTEFLFPKIWKVLVIKYETSRDPVYEENPEDKKLIKYFGDPKVKPYICNFSVIWKLREVCRLWCQTIDDFYQNLDVNYKMKYDAPKNPDRDECKWDICMFCKGYFGCWALRYNMNSEYTDVTIQELLNHFADTHKGGRSPFVSNTFQFSANHNEEYANDINLLLQKYGEHIWHCKIELEDDGLPTSECYTQICNNLVRMPNLLSLDIKWCKHMEEDSEICEQLLRNIEEFPMPTLTKLKYLSSYNVPNTVLCELLKRNTHIQALQVERDTNEVLSNIFLNEMTNISKLTFQICSKSELMELKQVNWNLEKVHLAFIDCEYIEWSEVLQFVEEKWANTATDVMIVLPIPRTKTNIKQHASDHHPLELNLPKVRRLRIDTPNLSSIDFILPMKNSLKELALANTFNDLQGSEKRLLEKCLFGKVNSVNSVIKVVGRGNEMETNIWTLFPKLECLELYKSFQSEHPHVYKRNEEIR